MVALCAGALPSAGCGKVKATTNPTVAESEAPAMPAPTAASSPSSSPSTSASTPPVAAKATVEPASPQSDEEPLLKVPRPPIISRQQWNARKTRGEGKSHEIDRITIHHTGVAQKPATTIEKKLQGLQIYSQSESKLANGKLKPAWLDVPYHFYVSVDGKIGEGRPIKYVSDTNTEYDPTRHATIVVEGNFENEKPTEAQSKALQDLTVWLSVKYQVPKSRIKAHNDYARTLCPGVNLKRALPALVEKVAELAGVPESR